MADYPDIDQISEIDPNTPAGGESAAKIDDSIRQIKRFLVDFLGTAHNDDGSISVVPTAGLVDLSVTTGKIADLAVTTAKLANLAVTAAKIASGTITATQLANGAVGTAQIADLNVTTGKIADLAVTTGKINAAAITTPLLGLLAVGTAQIADLAVTNGKIAAATIGPEKISNIGTAKLLVGDGTAAVAATVGGALTMTLVGTTATFAIGGVSSGIALILGYFEERAASGVSAGGTTAATYVNRPNLTMVLGAADVFAVSGGNIVLKPIGSYWIYGSVPGKNKFRVKLYDNTNSTDLVIGSSQDGAGRSFFSAVVTTLVANVNVKLMQWSDTTDANGLGPPITSGDTEVYGQITALHL